ncbi:MAG: type II secretion system major pseudopilin GspG [Alphaproteobacteria bacterium]
MSRTRPNRRAREAGLTLLELLVVITILGLLTVAVGSVALNYLGGAKTDTTALKVDQVMAGLDYFRLDVGRYPSEEEGLNALWKKPAGAERWNGPYVKKQDTLTDAWGKALVYKVPGENGPIDVYSLGSDGAEGGEGEAQDVTSW